MLDENLPTFRFKQSAENPLSSVIYFTQHGSEPEPEYVFKRADPATNPAARNKYAVALADPHIPGVTYGEVVISPEWTQPSLSAAEIRAQQTQNGGAPLAPSPMIPDAFTIQLYNPEQTIAVKMVPGSFTKTDSWEFEMLTQSFKVPSNSQLDRQNQNGSPIGNGEPVADFRPRVMFRWKKDGRISKDMTCFNVGKSVGKHKSKEPDITVALFKQSRDSAVTIYEPNLQRVDVEDRKGLDIVLVLGAEVIKDLYLNPRQDLFNLSGTPPVAKKMRKNSRPTPPPAAPMAAPVAAMSGALGATPPPQSRPVAPPLTSTANIAASSSGKPSSAEIDAETKRLQAMVQQEERERQARFRLEEKERERRDKEEQKRIKKMLDAEENERRKREAEIAKETERLKKLYGVDGQDMPSTTSTSPPLPPRPQFGGPPPQNLRPQQGGPSHPVGLPQPTFAPPPARPVSVGPGPGLFQQPPVSSWWRGPGTPSPAPGGMLQPVPPHQMPGRKPSGGPYLSGANPAATVSGFFQKIKDDGKRVTKKRSM